MRCCLRLFRKKGIQSKILLSMPQCSSFPIKPAWGTMTKAFDKSRMATTIWNLELKEDIKSWVVVRYIDKL